MTTCSVIANELRKLADALETAPELEVPEPYMAFHFWSHKESFFDLVKLLPKPLKKKYDEQQLSLNHNAKGLDLNLYIDRKAVCELVEPAKPAVYRCDPLLSDEEVEAV